MVQRPGSTRKDTVCLAVRHHRRFCFTPRLYQLHEPEHGAVGEARKGSGNTQVNRLGTYTTDLAVSERIVYGGTAVVVHCPCAGGIPPALVQRPGRQEDVDP